MCYRSSLIIDSKPLTILEMQNSEQFKPSNETPGKAVNQLMLLTIFSAHSNKDSSRLLDKTAAEMTPSLLEKIALCNNTYFYPKCLLQLKGQSWNKHGSLKKKS